MRGVLFDQPHVVDGAVVGERCEVVAGSFFDAVPAGADAYVLKAILHDWEDDDAVRILRRCRAAIPDDGALLVVERDLGAAQRERRRQALRPQHDGRRRAGASARAASSPRCSPRAASRWQSATPSAIGLSVFEGRPV